MAVFRLTTVWSVIDVSSTTVSPQIRFPGFGWSRAAPRGLNLNPGPGPVRAENYSYTQRPDVGHVQMVWRSYGDNHVPIFWITMNRPGPGLAFGLALAVRPGRYASRPMRQGL